MILRRRLIAVPALLAVVPLTTLALALAWSPPAAVVRQSLEGIAVTSTGGLLAGAVAARLLGRGSRSARHILGVLIVTAISVVTVGVFYLGLVRGPMASIGTTERALRQVPGFLAFLSAQVAGTLLVPRRAPGDAA